MILYVGTCTLESSTISAKWENRDWTYWLLKFRERIKTKQLIVYRETDKKTNIWTSLYETMYG